MSNLLWFLGLVIISLGLIYITYKKTDFRYNLAVYFFVMGLSFLMEYVVLILGDAYSYYPNFFSIQWYNDVFGSSISQAFFIPSVLMAIAAFRIRFRWIVLIIAVIFGIEELFLWLGIYEHNWWKSWFTSVILFTSIFVIKWWRNKVESPTFYIQFVTVYMAITTIFQGISFGLTAILGTHHYKIGWFESPFQDHIAFSVLIWIIYALLLTIIIIKYYRFKWLAVLFFADFAVNLIMEKMDILDISPNWNPIFFSMILILLLILIRKINNYMFL
ncbi:hypothetical protein AF332_12700 [Sporosarcina globispora]|uniref:Uncharacterized protein n=1 Tax=Sporosarcina globispora TaxID=1459 RepID=A0A0M0GKA6_SPOGL|nr:hypothetical protein [Sporosarcina globispora]KON90284.1 hypothetical protein AF332_12700 [Sporosarcina globispora]